MTEAHLNVLPKEIVDAATIDARADHSADPNGVGGAARRKIEEFGFCVVANVLSEAECAEVEKLFASDLRSIVALSDGAFSALPFARDVVNSWPLDKLSLGRRYPSFSSDYGIPQGRAAWHCRLHPTVRAIYEGLFETANLCSSCDNVFFNNKADHQPEASRVNRLWPHADQSTHVPKSGDWECFQGIVYIWPADENCSTTVVWPGSHRSYFPELMEARPRAGHYCELPPEHLDRFIAGGGRLTIPSGALLLWNSRTIHQGWSGGRRLAFPVCWEPKERRDQEALERKQMCVRRGFATTHWASLGKIHGSSCPDDGGTPAIPLKLGANKWALHPLPPGADKDADPDIVEEVAKAL